MAGGNLYIVKVVCQQMSALIVRYVCMNAWKLLQLSYSLAFACHSQRNVHFASILMFNTVGLEFYLRKSYIP
jgi:hypothetical protein